VIKYLREFKGRKIPMALSFRVSIYHGRRERGREGERERERTAILWALSFSPFILSGLSAYGNSAILSGNTLPDTLRGVL
jgi:hypothetical protein